MQVAAFIVFKIGLNKRKSRLKGLRSDVTCNLLYYSM